MEILLIFWLLCGVVCYFIMKSKGYPNNTCLAHGVGGALLSIIWIIVVLCKKNCSEISSSSQLSDMELLNKMMDLKERGAITEAEFEDKKREILSSVKKNNKSGMPISDLRNITAFLFLATCIICGIFWLLLETRITGNNGVLGYSNFSNWISSSFASMALACAIMVVILFMKADVRFLCIPIVVQSLRYFLSLAYVFRGGIFTILICLNILCAVSTILLFVLLFYPTAKEINYNSGVLYMIPGICRVLHFIGWFLFSGNSPLHVINAGGIYLLDDLLRHSLPYGAYSILISIAYILLGMFLQKLAMEKSTANALTK